MTQGVQTGTLISKGLAVNYSLNQFKKRSANRKQDIIEEMHGMTEEQRKLAEAALMVFESLESQVNAIEYNMTLLDQLMEAARAAR
jgi:hypothetical protein